MTMMGGGPFDRVPIAPQSIDAPLSRSAVFLVLMVSDADDAVDVVRSVLADLDGLVKTVGFRDLNGRLSCNVGIGSDAWSDLIGREPPAELHPFRTISGSVHTAISTPGDLLFHIRAERVDLTFEFERVLLDRLGGAVTVADEVHGFRYFDTRDLLGFVDGTANPLGLDLPASSLVGDEDPDFAGGSYVVVQKYMHPISAWQALDTGQQEAIIGRTKLDDVELDDAVSGQKSHKTLTTITDENGVEHDILRDNMPFGRPGQGEFGTYFIGYARNLWVIERMMERMFIGDPPGDHDRLLDFSTPLTGTTFFAPPFSMLSGLDSLVTDVASAEPSTTEVAGDTSGNSTQYVPGDRLPESSLEGKAMMMITNHLLRELAPITDDGWTYLDEEATARLSVALGARKLVDFTGPLGWDHPATNIGRVGPVVAAPADQVAARSRKVLALAEVRADFTLDRAELDSRERGAVDVDLAALDRAALRMATVENVAVFNGWDAAGMTGITQATPHSPISRSEDSAQFAQQVAVAVAVLKDAGVGGPYGLALDRDAWVSVLGGNDAGGASLLHHLQRILDGPVEWTPGVDGAVVLSLRGGDFIFESGEDLSIGYATHDAETVGLYLEETFSFRVATAEAAIALA